MICKHNIESLDGCKLCWKDRADRAEAALAAGEAGFRRMADKLAEEQAAHEFTANSQADTIKALESDKQMLLDRVQTLTGQNKEMREWIEETWENRIAAGKGEQP